MPITRLPNVITAAITMMLRISKVGNYKGALDFRGCCLSKCVIGYHSDCVKPQRVLVCVKRPVENLKKQSQNRERGL